LLKRLTNRHAKKVKNDPQSQESEINQQTLSQETPRANPQVKKVKSRNRHRLNRLKHPM
jgi:hypothetical protein